jgi:O-methyltransferase involved in polyketide biosynthesis
MERVFLSMTETEKIQKDVSGTAFLVNYSRSKMVDISKDVYASLWVTPDTISLWNELSSDVYPDDDLNLSLRNRYYLEQIRTFIDANEDPVCVVLASGFTSYPFLIEDRCRFVECDLPNIMEFKKKRVAEWVRDGKLPKRQVEYISADLNDDKQRAGLKDRLREIIGNKPSIVTLEGITYYLGSDVLTDIFQTLSEIQQEGSAIAFDYWKSDALDYPVMVKLKKYLEINFGPESHDWNLFGDDYIEKLRGYNKIDSADVAALELKYSETKKFQGIEGKIPDCFALLERA